MIGTIVPQPAHGARPTAEDTAPSLAGSKAAATPQEKVGTSRGSWLHSRPC